MAGGSASLEAHKKEENLMIREDSRQDKEKKENNCEKPSREKIGKKVTNYGKPKDS